MAQAIPILSPEITSQDPWLTLMTLRHLITPIASVEAILARDLGGALDVWTLVHHSDARTRASLADQQWEFMRLYPDVDVDFHIVERGGIPLESFVSPAECDLFVRVR